MKAAKRHAERERRRSLQTTTVSGGHAGAGMGGASADPSPTAGGYLMPPPSAADSTAATRSLVTKTAAPCIDDTILARGSVADRRRPLIKVRGQEAALTLLTHSDVRLQYLFKL